MADLFSIVIKHRFMLSSDNRELRTKRMEERCKRSDQPELSTLDAGPPLPRSS